MIRVGSSEDHGLSLDAIQIDGGTQSRALLNDHVVNDYAEAIKAGATFPPIVVFYDGKKHWLADGFHRFHAYQKAGKAKVAADVRQGTRRDAILHSVGANETHGLRRTRDDKRRAVLTLLNDAEWGKWTDREIARRCAVSPQTVANVRADTVQNGQSDERTYVHPKTGKPTMMKTAGINASRAKPEIIAEGAKNSGGDEKQEITSQTVASQGVEGGDEPEKPVEEITYVGGGTPIEIVDTRTNAERDADTLQSAWDRACEQGRAMFLARNDLKSSDGMASGSEHHSVARNGANMEQGDVDSSASARTPAGEDSFALAGQIETRTEAEIVDGNASLAAREGEKPLQSHSPSDDDAFSEVKGTARPESAAGVEPSSSEAVADNPQAPRPSATAPLSNPQPTSSPDAEKAGTSATPPAAVPAANRWAAIRPHCLRPELCAGSGSKHCYACLKARDESEAA